MTIKMDASETKIGGPTPWQKLVGIICTECTRERFEAFENKALRFFQENKEACMQPRAGMFGDTLLLVAIYKGMQKMALEIIRNDIDGFQRKQTNEQGHTPLMAACLCEMKGVAMHLLDLGGEECRALHVNKHEESARQFAHVFGLKKVETRIKEYMKTQRTEL